MDVVTKCPIPHSRKQSHSKLEKRTFFVSGVEPLVGECISKEYISTVLRDFIICCLNEAGFCFEAKHFLRCYRVNCEPRGDVVLCFMHLDDFTKVANEWMFKLLSLNAERQMLGEAPLLFCRCGPNMLTRLEPGKSRKLPAKIPDPISTYGPNQEVDAESYVSGAKPSSAVASTSNRLAEPPGPPLLAPAAEAKKLTVSLNDLIKSNQLNLNSLDNGAPFVGGSNSPARTNMLAQDSGIVRRKAPEVPNSLSRVAFKLPSRRSKMALLSNGTPFVGGSNLFKGTNTLVQDTNSAVRINPSEVTDSLSRVDFKLPSCRSRMALLPNPSASVGPPTACVANPAFGSPRGESSGTFEPTNQPKVSFGNLPKESNETLIDVPTRPNVSINNLAAAARWRPPPLPRLLTKATSPNIIIRPTVQSGTSIPTSRGKGQSRWNSPLSKSPVKLTGSNANETSLLSGNVPVGSQLRSGTTADVTKPSRTPLLSGSQVGNPTVAIANSPSQAASIVSPTSSTTSVSQPTVAIGSLARIQRYGDNDDSDQNDDSSSSPCVKSTANEEKEAKGKESETAVVDLQANCSRTSQRPIASVAPFCNWGPTGPAYAMRFPGPPWNCRPAPLLPGPFLRPMGPFFRPPIVPDWNQRLPDRSWHPPGRVGKATKRVPIKGQKKAAKKFAKKIKRAMKHECRGTAPGPKEKRPFPHCPECLSDENEDSESKDGRNEDSEKKDENEVNEDSDVNDATEGSEDLEMTAENEDLERTEEREGNEDSEMKDANEANEDSEIKDKHEGNEDSEIKDKHEGSEDLGRNEEHEENEDLEMTDKNEDSERKEDPEGNEDSEIKDANVANEDSEIKDANEANEDLEMMDANEGNEGDDPIDEAEASSSKQGENGSFGEKAEENKTSADGTEAVKQNENVNDDGQKGELEASSSKQSENGSSVGKNTEQKKLPTIKTAAEKQEEEDEKSYKATRRIPEAKVMGSGGLTRRLRAPCMRKMEKNAQLKPLDELKKEIANEWIRDFHLKAFYDIFLAGIEPLKGEEMVYRIQPGFWTKFGFIMSPVLRDYALMYYNQLFEFRNKPLTIHDFACCYRQEDNIVFIRCWDRSLALALASLTHCSLHTVTRSRVDSGLRSILTYRYWKKEKRRTQCELGMKVKAILEDYGIRDIYGGHNNADSLRAGRKGVKTVRKFAHLLDMHEKGTLESYLKTLFEKEFEDLGM